MSGATQGSPAAPRRLSALKGLWPFLRPYRARMALAFMLLCLGSASILLVPLAFRDLIDFGFGAGQATGGGLLATVSLNGHFVALFGLASFWAVAVAARYYTVSWIGERATADLRGAVYAKVLTQSPQFFETLQTGEVLSRLTGDATLVQTVVGSSVSLGLRSLFQCAGGMVMLAVTSFPLFALNLGLLAALALPILAIGRNVRRLSRESQDRIADASALAGEILNAMPTVQANTQEPREAQRFAERAEISFATAIRRTRVRAALTALIITAVMGTGQNCRRRALRARPAGRPCRSALTAPELLPQFFYFFHCGVARFSGQCGKRFALALHQIEQRGISINTELDEFFRILHALSLFRFGREEGHELFARFLLQFNRLVDGVGLHGHESLHSFNRLLEINIRVHGISSVGYWCTAAYSIPFLEGVNKL